DRPEGIDVCPHRVTDGLDAPVAGLVDRDHPEALRSHRVGVDQVAGPDGRLTAGDRTRNSALAAAETRANAREVLVRGAIPGPDDRDLGVGELERADVARPA